MVFDTWYFRFYSIVNKRNYVDFQHYQKKSEYLDRQMNRRFWRWFGIGAAVSLLIHLAPNPTDQGVGIDHETPLDEQTD